MYEIIFPHYEIGGKRSDASPEDGWTLYFRKYCHPKFEKS